MHPFENVAMGIAMDSKWIPEWKSKLDLSGFSLSALFEEGVLLQTWPWVLPWIQKLIQKWIPKLICLLFPSLRFFNNESF